MNEMRILVQDCDSSLFLSAQSLWTDDAAQAQEFISTAAALNACRQLRGDLRRENLQIVLKFQHSAHDVCLPLLGSNC